MNCLQQRFAIQWYLARPCIISGQDKMPALQEILGYFLNWKSLKNYLEPIGKRI